VGKRGGRGGVSTKTKWPNPNSGVRRKRGTEKKGGRKCPWKYNKGQKHVSHGGGGVEEKMWYSKTSGAPWLAGRERRVDEGGDAAKDGRTE